MRDDDKQKLKIELLSQWKMEAESRNIARMRMLSPSLFIQGSQCNCYILLFSIVRNVISVTSVKSQVISF